VKYLPANVFGARSGSISKYAAPSWRGFVFACSGCASGKVRGVIRLRGIGKLGALFDINLAAYNLARMPRLLAT